MENVPTRAYFIWITLADTDLLPVMVIVVCINAVREKHVGLVILCSSFTCSVISHLSNMR